jgi:WD40 repeat protein
MRIKVRYFKRSTVSVWIVFLIAYLSVCITLRQSRAETPERTIPWPSPVKKFINDGANSDYMWARSSEPDGIQVWQWSDNTIVKQHQITLPENTYSILILPPDRWLSKENSGFCTGDLKTAKVIDRWPGVRELSIMLQQSSRNGKYHAVSAIQDFNYAEKEGVKHDFETTHIGLIFPDKKAIRWIADLTPEYENQPSRIISKVIPSDDGKFIGVVSVDGVAMIDVSNKKVLWTASYNHKPALWNVLIKNKVPWKQVSLDSVSMDDLAFSPDAKMAYVGSTIASDTVGAAGCIWGIKVETGEIVNKWGTATPKREEYCRDITTVAVSPDGRFVAAGVTPTGLVFLYSTKDGKRRILKHSDPGRIDFVSFSPDSTRLATYAGYPPPYEIKIWKLPEEEKASSASSSSGSKSLPGEK